MKIRESGMPEENYWNSFFKVELIFKELDINISTQNIAEIGCGYGTFTIPVSKIISGKVYAFDIEQNMIDIVTAKIQNQHIENIELFHCDIIAASTHLPQNSVDYVMLFNILHHDKPEDLLNETYRILKTGGKVGVIHWRTDIETPRGPSIQIRTKPEECLMWLKNSHFNIEENVKILEPFHFGIIAKKV